MLDNCEGTATQIEAYITAHLFDPSGIMCSGVDMRTGKPFAPEFLTPRKVGRRAAFDPWSYWTYEDSVMSLGLYLDGLVLQHEVTGCPSCLKQAESLWHTIEAIYSCSQVHGLGSFLRPYGGFLQMARFLEPLGTDQASPLFSGLYRFLPYVEPRVATDIRRVLRNTLVWYEQQGFRYFYYKRFIHSYAPESPNCNHANSYFLPAIAWAAVTYPEDSRWQRHLEERLVYFAEGRYTMYPRGSRQPAFCWGSDLDVLHRILGARFREVFTVELLDEAYAAVNEVLAEYSEPGTIWRMFPESADPDFRPALSEFDPETYTGSVEDGFYAPHHGRCRPRHEVDFLLGLASTGYRTQEIAARAAELLAFRSAVPEDFTYFLSEDYDQLPETVHLYARSVGVMLVEWWRDYWLLRKALREHPA